MDLFLFRTELTAAATIGVLVGERITPFVTLEPPWISSAEFPSGVPARSCVPIGAYRLEQRAGSFGERWYLSNPELGVFLNAQSGQAANARYSCLIHPGNYLRNTKGCILPGELFYHAGQMVTSSRATLERFELELDGRGDEHTLEISDGGNVPSLKPGEREV